ncbi:MAG: iron-containing redox enzyme family protein [Nitrospirae bacterium]|nr:iron-containing redox enzyme family protein [Nitrospirota bacterium]MBI3594939.1 iron-containing redox enzyme family protein [Nitrospirota bacterium]
MIPFIQHLQREIEEHDAVHHPFLKKFSTLPLTLDQIRIFGLQHYQLVKIFVNYMTNLQPRIPDSSAAALFRHVYDDEFGQHTIFRSHPALYRNFLKSLGLEDNAWGRVIRLSEVESFVETHMELTRDDDFRIALGAIGPGHEFSIPTMFSYLVKGIEKNTSLKAEDYEYFTCHMVQDVHHAEIFNELISHFDTAEDQQLIRSGAMKSLEARKLFWDGLEKAIFSPVLI